MQDLYKKICSADPISRRLPYAKSSKMFSLRGMLRFGLNRPLTFNNAREEKWGIIYRRSLVIKMKAKSTQMPEYEEIHSVNREEAGIFANGDTLNPFLESRPAAAAFIVLIYDSVNLHTSSYSSIRRIAICPLHHRGRRPRGASSAFSTCRPDVNVPDIDQNVRIESESESDICVNCDAFARLEFLRGSLANM